MATPIVAAEPRALRLFSRAVALFVDGAIALSAFTVLVSLVLIGYSVAMRYGLNRPQVWVDDAVGFLLVATVMLAVAQVQRRGEHIGVDVFTERLGARAARWAHFWSALATGVVAVVLVLYGTSTAMQSREFGVIAEGHLELPIWWLMMFLPLGGVLLCLVSIESIWRLALGLPSVATHVSHGESAE